MTTRALTSFQRWRPLLDGLAAEINPLRWSAAGVSEAAAKKLISNFRARRLLSLRLEWLGLPTADGDGNENVWPDWSAWENADAAALFSGAELLCCGLRLGAALFRSGIARLVLGKDVAAFKATVGADAYFFAMRQAVLVREADALSRERVGVLALPESVVRAGNLALASWLCLLPGNLEGRVALKLPPAMDAVRTEITLWPEDEREKWRAALTRVFLLTVGRE